MNRTSHLLFLLVLALMAGGLFATDGRMISLGYPYGFIRDDSDVHVYPATIFKYNRGVTGELYWDEYYYDKDDDELSWCWTLGTNVPVGKNVFGAYLNMPVDPLVNLDLINGDYKTRDDLDLSRKQQFYFGFKDHFALGLGYAADSYSQKWEGSEKYENSENESAMYLELDGGMSFERMDLGLMAYLYNGKSGRHMDEAYVEDYSASGFGADLHGRYFVQETDLLDVVATADLGFSNGAWTTYEEPDQKSDSDLGGSAFMGGLGLGADYKITPNHHIVLSLAPVRFFSQKMSLKTSGESDFTDSELVLFIPEYTLGLESQVTKWLTGRIGAIQSIQLWKWTHNDDWEEGFNLYEESDYTPYFDMNCGLGFHFGKFNVDAVLSKRLLHEGPSFIGGMSGGFASHISVNFQY